NDSAGGTADNGDNADNGDSAGNADNGDDSSDASGNDPGHNDPPKKAPACKSDGSPKRADEKDCPNESASSKKGKDTEKDAGKDTGKDSGKDKGDKAKKGDADNGDPCESGGKGWMNKVNCALRPN